MKSSLLLSVSFFVSIALFGQFNFGYNLKNDLPVVVNSDSLSLAWAGGLNTPQFGELEINFDDNTDLMVYDLDGKQFKCFTRNGPGAEFTWLPNCDKCFPKTSSQFYAITRDYNADGKMDLITANNGYLWIYKNTSDTTLQFERVTPYIPAQVYGQAYKDKDKNFTFYMGTPEFSIPEMMDVDGDGDLDVFLVKRDPGTNLFPVPISILLIQNLSVETHGVVDSLVFQEANSCWGKIKENDLVTGYEFFDCDIQKAYSTGRHEGGSTITILDLDGDELMDVLLGDATSGTLASGFNTNDNILGEVDIQSMDLTFPSYDTPVNLPTLVASYHLDIDQDGKRDLMTVPNQVSTASEEGTTKYMDWYYKNTGTDGNPVFELEKQGLLTSEMIEVGKHSSPALGDVNGDGLADLMIGNLSYPIGNNDYATIALFLNVGTEEEPVFELTEENLSNITQFQWNRTHPALADLNGDGLADLIIGDDQGKLHYFENSGSGGNHQFNLTEAEFSGIDVGLNAHPSFFDFNQDNYMDLMIGNAAGKVHYFENRGNASSPDFEANPTISNFGGIDMADFGGESTPYFTRALDSVFGVYAIVGSGEGKVFLFGPMTGVPNNLIPADSIVLDCKNSVVTGHDIRGDFRVELFIGQLSGGLNFLSRDQNIRPGITDIKNEFNLKVYPNPASDVVTVSVKKDIPLKEICLFELSGRMVVQQSCNSNIHQLDVSELSSGFYSVNVTLADGTVLQSKLIKP